MPLIEEFEASGKWLFRWRSYLPLLFLALMFASVGHFSYPFNSPFLDQMWECFCIALGIGGVTIRGLVAGYAPSGTSGRNRKQQVAETLNTSGIYSVVRNPLYFGNFLIGLAITLFLHTWWLSLIYSLAFVLYYERIIFAEEMFLRQKFGSEFIAWATRTPAFFPRLSQWRRATLPFSWRTFIRREYQGVFAFILVLFTMEQLTEVSMGHGWYVDLMWKWIFGLTTLGYLIVRLLVKNTSIFRVDGR